MPIAQQCACDSIYLAIASFAGPCGGDNLSDHREGLVTLGLEEGPRIGSRRDNQLNDPLTQGGANDLQGRVSANEGRGSESVRELST
jgi:hypothetical protein